MSDLPHMVEKVDSALQVSIKVPANWQETPARENQLLFSSPPEKEFNNYQSRISYTKTTPKSDDETWLEELIEKSAAQQRETYDGYQILKEERFTIDDQRAYLRHSEYQYPVGNVKVVNTQGLVISDPETLYIIKGETVKPLAEAYLPIFEAIIKSTQKVSE